MECTVASVQIPGGDRRRAIAGVVCATAAPAVVVRLRLSRRRAGVMWTLGPLERREFFFGAGVLGRFAGAASGKLGRRVT